MYGYRLTRNRAVAKKAAPKKSLGFILDNTLRSKIKAENVLTPLVGT